MKPEKFLNPAAAVIAKLGGPQAVATALGKAIGAPYRWMAPREKGGTGGFIPHWLHADLLAYAASTGVELSAQDFVAIPAPDNAPTPAEAAE